MKKEKIVAKEPKSCKNSVIKCPNPILPVPFKIFEGLRSMHAQSSIEKFSPGRTFKQKS